MSELYRISAMLFHDDMIYLSKQVKYNVEKSFALNEDLAKSIPVRDFFSFMSTRRKYADVLPVLAQNENLLPMACP